MHCQHSFLYPEITFERHTHEILLKVNNSLYIVRKEDESSYTDVPWWVGRPGVELVMGVMHTQGHLAP